MQVKIKASHDDGCKRLLQRMLSPLCGLDTRIDFTRRNWLDSRFIVADAELTGVHVLLKQPPPTSGYHIGGAGIFLEEVLLRVLGETIERYAQLMSGINYQHEIVMATYNELKARGEHVLSGEKMRFFSSDQYGQPQFPFSPFSPTDSIGWIKMPSLIDDAQVWVPAQLVLVGYAVKHEQQEPWLLAAVTTGSAAHTSQRLALRTGLLELIELDSVMGHWYSASTLATEIQFDERTQAIERLLEKHCNHHKPRPTFYWLPNADLPGLTIACVMRQRPGVLPAVCIGLGCSLSLVEAMYKALLEAIGLERLGPAMLASYSLTGDEVNPQHIFDLDHNIVYYSSHENSEIINARFPIGVSQPASALPADSTLEPEEQICYLVDCFRGTGKELFLLDLTAFDIKELGFTALRVWSPDTLSMCLPSCPLMAHPRFKAYGGCSHDAPHPYP